MRQTHLWNYCQSNKLPHRLSQVQHKLKKAKKTVACLTLFVLVSILSNTEILMFMSNDMRHTRRRLAAGLDSVIHPANRRIYLTS